MPAGKSRAHVEKNELFFIFFVHFSSGVYYRG